MLRLIVYFMLLLFIGACSYKGSEPWRRQVCEEIVDAGERARCLEDATASENEYEQKRRKAGSY